MKTPALLTLAATLLLTAAPSSAQSTAIPQHLSRSVTHSGAASGQALAASGEVGISAVKATAGATALAFWTGGSATASVGTVVGALGESTTKTGNAAQQSGNALWDFASGDPAKRPIANRQRSVPPPAKQTVRRDPPPGEMLRVAQR